MSTTAPTERSETPNQHLPPSLPNSPLPKRVKAQETRDMAEPTPTPTPGAPAVPPPTATSSAPLPPVSALLPSVTSGAALPQTALASVPPLFVQKLAPAATTPTRGSAFAAGYDLYASSPITIKAKNKALVSTSIAIAVPAGTYGRIAPRSGLASKHFLDTGAGVIDADYRGEVKVLMFNFSDVDYEVKQGERIAQLVLERIVTPEVVEVEALEASVRGAGGFGSTGYI